MELREYLFRKDLKQSWFAARLGVTYKTFWGIVRRKSDMKLSIAAKIVKETQGEVSYEDLFPAVKEQEMNIEVE